jgi:hypothetical protein
MSQDQEPQRPNTPPATSAVGQSRVMGHTEHGDDQKPPSKRSAKPRTKWYTTGDGVTRAALVRSYERSHDDPIYRPLKIYTVDPSLGRLQGATAVINVPYEPLKPGPTGTRFIIEAVPNNPFGQYPPVNLEDPRILIKNGRDPAPSDPAFHHQMAYAVCCSVYAAFRAALGRELAWTFQGSALRVQPHGASADSPHYTSDGYLKFGWIQEIEKINGKAVSRGNVFSCLSHDIITHELTHALLEGLRAQFKQGSGADVDAFHEALGDLVALFQRYSYKDVVKGALRRTGGKLTEDNLLNKLGLEFARALGVGQALRHVHLDVNSSSSDKVAEDKAEKIKDAASLETYATDSQAEPHILSEILVSAVLNAFATVYTNKTAAYFRLASQGTGLFLPGAELPADLLELLAEKAIRVASQFLAICIRAIDYCPPVDIEFGEYLRALITADYNLVPDDPWAYREALIAAFARRRIYPRGVGTMSEDALLWQPPAKPLRVQSLDFASLRFSGDPGSPAGEKELLRQADALGAFVSEPENLLLFGCAPRDHPDLRGDEVDLPRIESIRSSRRVGPDDQLVFDLVAEVTQRRYVKGNRTCPGDFEFYGGSTVILGPKGEVRYVVYKEITDNERLERQRKFLHAQRFVDVDPGKDVSPT